MTKDFLLWENNIRDVVEQLRDIELREHVGEAFRHVMTELYGRVFFREFITSQAWRQAGLKEETGNQLAKLNQQLNEFDEPDSDEALKMDANWRAIQVQATHVATLLKRHK